MRQLSRPLITAAAFGFAVILAGCAGTPSAGEKMMAQGDSLKSVGKDWVEGEELVRKGEDLINHGEDDIDFGEARISRGKDRVREGRMLVERGTKLMKESEKAYQQTRSGG